MVIEFDAKFSFLTGAENSDDKSAVPMDVSELFAKLSEDNCLSALSSGGIAFRLLASKIIVSIEAHAIFPISVATAELVKFFPLQLIVTVVVLPVVNAHVHVPKSAAGGQRQISFV